MATAIKNFFRKLRIEGTTGDGYHVLLFGETGSGKSTVINYMTNFFRAGSLDELKIAIPTKFHGATENFRWSEANLSDSTKSKTKDCINYDFQLEGVSFRFIDTPGLSDTDGVDKDDENIEKIMAAAEETGKLAAVIIVINGTVARTTVNLQNALVRMRGSMPDILLNNLLVVLTNCTVASRNFEIKSLEPWIIPEENVFYMNNSALSQDPKTWKHDAKMRKQIGRDWEDSFEEINRLAKRITELGKTATTAFKDMRQKREAIKSEICSVLLEIDKCQKLHDKLKSAEAANLGATENIKLYSNYKETQEVEYEVLEDAPFHSTICAVHTDKVCHENCGVEFSKTFGSWWSMSQCQCMDGWGNPICNVCGCGYETHFFDMKKLSKLKKTVENILHDVKEQHDHFMGQKQDLEKNISTLASEMSEVERVLANKDKTISDLCTQLKKICSQFNFVGELKSVINMLKTRSKTLTSLAALSEAENRIKNIEGLAKRLSGSGEK